MNILAVGAHPDDLEILCGGTLIRYHIEGHSITMGSVCNGNKGHRTLPGDKLAKIRLAEAQNSARIIHAQHFCLNIPDCEVYVNREAMEKVLNLIRQAKPDIIITHSPNDYMPDHRVVSELVFQASFHATLPLYNAEQPPHDKITPVLYMDTLAGVDFNPTMYVDITDVFEQKLAMLRCHKSQRDWLDDHDAIDMDEFMTAVARFRGLQCSKKYAEGFRSLDVWGRNRTQRLLP
ncbi:PIG-L family deacetylase [candidate division KSB1 bacterium]|nr:PIG-L family deacetylase [candidate division KSB1 bacterium]